MDAPRTGRVAAAAAVLLLLATRVRPGAGQGDEAPSSTSKSCFSQCHESSPPYCATLMRGDNAQSVSGTYKMHGSGRLNLTCVATSLPTPVHITWHHQADTGSMWFPVECATLLTTKDCRVDPDGSHRVVSNCMLELKRFNQTGVYQCRATQIDSPRLTTAQSATAEIRVAGVALADQQHPDRGHSRHEKGHLKMGHVDHLDKAVCANPEPMVVWLNRETGESVRAGGPSVGRYNALPLQKLMVQRGDRLTQVDYCYMARLVIGGVVAKDAHFVLFVSNEVEVKQLAVRASISAAPSPHSPPRRLLMLATAAVLLVIAARF